MTTDSTRPPSEWLDGLTYRIWRANQVLTRQLAASIDDLGVSITQLAIVVHLDELGHMSGSDLARLFRITPQSATTALNRIEELGWVTRVAHPGHRRVIWYEVTEKGAEAAIEGRRRVAEVNRRIDARLSESDRAHLVTALAEVTTELDDA